MSSDELENIPIYRDDESEASYEEPPEAIIIIPGSIQAHNIVTFLLLEFLRLATIKYRNLRDRASRTLPRRWHDSEFTGPMWLAELLKGHPGRLRRNLGVSLYVFRYLAHALDVMGCVPGRSICVDEQLAIFLHTCVLGAPLNHIADRFQHSPSTISKYFRHILTIFSGPGFFQAHIQPPELRIHPFIAKNARLSSYFYNVLGAIDGVHFPWSPPVSERLGDNGGRDRDGGFTMNCLCACDWDMRILFMLPGFPGSTSDSSMYNSARFASLGIPAGFKYVADAGFPTCPQLLIPFRGQRYHLREWRGSAQQPETPAELYNLRHAHIRNVVERVFGVLKRRFAILRVTPELRLDDVANLPCALGAIHNVILSLDPVDDQEGVLSDDKVLQRIRDEAELLLSDTAAAQELFKSSELATVGISETEKNQALAYRQALAERMWVDYQANGPGDIVGDLADVLV